MWLEYPLTRGRKLDDPQTTVLRRQIIRSKPFLLRIYDEWYSTIAGALPLGSKPVLELGSGAGFLGQFVPNLITSEMFAVDGLSVVLDGLSLPFARASLRAIVMTNVLHHVADCRRFFREAARCIHTGGRIVMIEPWVTPWSRLVYRGLHHEPFRPEAQQWAFPSSGPLSGANGALPWIVFSRDRQVFEGDFPEWRIRRIQPTMPFRYLLSGGVSMRSLVPTWSYGLWACLERALSAMDGNLAMFAVIVVERTEEAGPL